MPGARFVFRNFVGWTEVPERWREVVVEDRAAGEALISGDRSAVQRRIAVCRVEGVTSGVATRSAGRTPADNDALVELSVACPMEGDIGLAVDRAPDFFALNRLEGDAWRVGVVDGPDGRPVGLHRRRRAPTSTSTASPARRCTSATSRSIPPTGAAAWPTPSSTWARDACVAAHGPDAPGVPHRPGRQPGDGSGAWKAPRAAGHGAGGHLPHPHHPDPAGAAAAPDAAAVDRRGRARQDDLGGDGRPVGAAGARPPVRRRPRRGVARRRGSTPPPTSTSPTTASPAGRTGRWPGSWASGTSRPSSGCG